MNDCNPFLKTVLSNQNHSYICNKDKNWPFLHIDFSLFCPFCGFKLNITSILNEYQNLDITKVAIDDNCYFWNCPGCGIDLDQ